MKKVIYIVLGALLVFGLLFLLWSFFFNHSANTQNQTGSFGSAGDRSASTTIPTQAGNGQTPLGNNAANGTVSLGGGAQSAVNVGASGGVSVVGNPTQVSTTTGVSGVDWLGDATGNGITPVNNGFTPIDINGLNGASIGGTAPTIGGGVGNNTGNNNGGLFAAAGLIGLATCALNQFGIGAAGGALGSRAVGTLSGAVAVNDALANGYKGSDEARNFAGCIVNGIAKAILQQITVSVVNWINSGFNGQPSFVTNYQNFFANVADLAAGNFIQGSGLAFLCSPFQLQIKIAVAQAYANRNAAQSCTLSKVVGNVNNFMNGNFSSGGWGGLLSFTTIPTNNPYGAYAYAQAGLVSAQAAAIANAKNNITPNGFLSLQQVSCPGSTQPSFRVSGNLLGSPINQQAALAGGSGTLPAGCKASVTTPGTVIESSLASTLDTPLKQLGLANDLDQIINALLNQLMVKTLYNGLSNLSGTTGLQSSYQTPEQTAAQQKAQDLLNQMQAQYALAQQYGSILQGSISDIENEQQQVNNSLNCWLTAASSTNLTAAQQSSAASAANTASSTLETLNEQVNAYNNSILLVNNEIAQLENLQTEALSVASTADVQTLANNYASIQQATPFITQTDVTTAQQNRTTLQAQMSTLQQSTQTQLDQCNAEIGTAI